MEFDIKLENMSVRESVIENHFCDTAPEYGCIEKKLLAFMGLRSWPDRMLLWPAGTKSKRGITDYVELKRPKGGRFEPGQERLHEDLRAMGFNVVVLSTKLAVDEYYRTRAAELGVKRRPKLSTSHKRGDLSIDEFLAAQKRSKL